ncbi:MAG TPA: biotin/lipoyl-binding protein, partial [Sulfurivirga caldicuralii]|nr:biotin/lipoyl-binding protein [Sulfurivirga caldicuralii]
MNANQDKTLKQDVADAEALLQNEVPTDAQRFLRWGLLILLIGFGGFVFWATTAPLDAGVPAPATAIVQGERKIIAHPKGGTVKAIHVQEAQYVTKGQPLLELDDTQLRSEYINTLQEYAAQLAQLARLEAEKNGAKEIHFPDSLLDLPPESNAQTQMQLQQQLFAARARALENALNILEQQAQANEANAKAKAQQLALLNRQLESVRQLVNEGYA